MSTSERLEKIEELIRAARVEVRRLMVDLPDGRTLEIQESVEARLGSCIALENGEARELRRWRD